MESNMAAALLHETHSGGARGAAANASARRLKERVAAVAAYSVFAISFLFAAAIVLGVLH